MGSYLYLIGGALLILAILISRFRGGGNTLRARDVSGNVNIGNVTGSVTQTSTSSGDKGKPEPDRVAWGIAIVGVLVALGQFVQGFVK